MFSMIDMFSMIEELRSHAFCKIAALVSSRGGYPELQDISDNPLPSDTCVISLYNETNTS